MTRAFTRKFPPTLSSVRASCLFFPAGRGWHCLPVESRIEITGRGATGRPTARECNDQRFQTDYLEFSSSGCRLQAMSLSPRGVGAGSIGGGCRGWCAQGTCWVVKERFPCLAHAKTFARVEQPELSTQVRASNAGCDVQYFRTAYCTVPAHRGGVWWRPRCFGTVWWSRPCACCTAQKFPSHSGGWSAPSPRGEAGTRRPDGGQQM